MLPDYCYSIKQLNNPSMIVIHYFSAIYVNPLHAFDPETCIDLFIDLNNRGSSRGRVIPPSGEPRQYASAHYLIDRQGVSIPLVPLDKQAYHAGVSKWKDKENLNAHSFGIELIATHDSGYTDEQYITCAEVCGQLMTKYGILLEDVVGHSDVAPDRKKDPGPLFEWERLRAMLKNINSKP
jgi:N-acetyl-anhydromuramyl-L-alanine amidase AmpD